MTKEDRKLLLKDLCARVPYGVYLHNKNGLVYRLWGITDTTHINDSYLIEVEEIKPYLRSMSSMTEEEMDELESITFPLMEKDWDGNENPACIRWIDIPKYMDFILSHHFDYQGLIEKGLAIEVTKDNNPYKN